MWWTYRPHSGNILIGLCFAIKISEWIIEYRDEYLISLGFYCLSLVLIGTRNWPLARDNRDTMADNLWPTGQLMSFEDTHPLKWKSLILSYENEIHYNHVIMSAKASKITSLTIVYSSVYSSADQRKHQSSASLPLWGEYTGDWWIPRTKGQ